MSGHRSSIEDNLNNSGGESSMFKELFTTANKGIAGISFEQNADLPSADEKALNKQRSKKDLKNKFQSSSTTVEFDDKENKNTIDESEVEEIIK